jgi:ATP-binding cassette subfamily B protein
VAVGRTARQAVLAGAGRKGSRLGGRQVWALLRKSGKALSVGVIAWVVAGATIPSLVVVSLGYVVGAIPGAVHNGMNSPAGHQLIEALVVAGVIYGVSLILDPVGEALGTAARQKITGQLQARLLRAVSGPATVTHLEDRETLDRLARAEGTLTGFFPGDAPVTWAGIAASRLSGIVGCIVISAYIWWLGALLFVMWVLVRRAMLTSVITQATDLRGQTHIMRRAWYFTGVGSKPRDAKEIRVFGLAGFVADQYQAWFTEAIRAGRAGLQNLHRRAALSFLVVLAGYALSVYVVTDATRAHEIGLRSAAIMLPMLSVTMSVGSVSFGDISLAWTLTGLPDADRLEGDLAVVTQPEPPSSAGGPRPIALEASVRFEAVRFKYPSGTSDVLSGVDLELRAGTSTALVGVNGAGKSTLVSLLAGLRDASGGRILVDGTDIREFSPARWQRMVALMPQSPVHYPLSAYDNVAFGAIEHADDREGVDRAARMAGFRAVVDELPFGWDTVMSRELPDGADLSGGQWQRLALARALFATFHGARVLVLDEPTAALDVRSEARFYERFHEITAGLTTLVISHRFATVRRASQIAVLDGGMISECGSHDELVALGGTYGQMYAVQAARFTA